jgi:hypothetical protein
MQFSLLHCSECVNEEMSQCFHGGEDAHIVHDIAINESILVDTIIWSDEVRNLIVKLHAKMTILKRLVENPCFLVVRRPRLLPSDEN